MGFRINQNIGAMVALNNLQQNDMSISKSIERLSTGLRIVRGADDPSGLVISERFRAQVEGLGQAVSNAKDGINMVQTAEGALDEVSQVLRNMRNVAVHAANTGPNDAATLEADQNQMREAIKTLDRIASQTQFGAKKVLDGSAGVTGTVTNANVRFVSGTTKTADGTYAVNITTAAAKGKVTSNANGGAAVARGTQNTTGANATDGNALTGAETLTITGAMSGGANIAIALTTGDDVDDMIDKINQNADVKSAGLTASNVGGKIQLASDRLGAGTAAELDMTITNANGGTAVSGLAAAGANTYSQDDATGATKLRNDELLTFSNGTNTVNVSLTAGMTTAAAVSAINTALDNAGIGVTAGFDSTDAVFTLENDAYGSSSTVSNTFSSNLSGANSTGLAGAAGTSYNIAGSGAALSGADGSDGADVAGTIGGFAATGSGQFLTGNAGTDVEGLEIKVSGGGTGAHGTVTAANNSLTFQIGAFADQTATLAIGAMTSTSLGTDAAGVSIMSSVSVSNIDVSSGDGQGAQDAIKVLDAAISQVSKLRSQIGSFQKDILESTVRTLGVAKQNLASSESNIRDADFAAEMMTFSRSQILSQTGMSMLTQANQAGQSVLSLFR
ncbi:MAG: flagellin [Vulcanimicrobiota bacterium]